jgi:hypothetical protein
LSCRGRCGSATLQVLRGVPRDPITQALRW